MQQHGMAVAAGQGSRPASGEGGGGQRPKRGAVIGASAQLDPQGLLEAARAAEEKVILLRKQAEMEEAKRKAEAKKQAARQASQQAASGGDGEPAAPAAAPGPVAGAVQGVIHESGWAARRRQQQQVQPR